MRIVVATPLYPPDPSPTAAYAKELARRLAGSHTVTVLAYTHLPESLRDVAVSEVPKNKSTIVRIALFLRELLAYDKQTDLVLAINGPSVDVPLFFYSILTGRPYVRLVQDTAAREKEAPSALRSVVGRVLDSKAQAVYTDFPEMRPEIHSVNQDEDKKLEHHEARWKAHLASLETTYANT